MASTPHADSAGRPSGGVAMVAWGSHEFIRLPDVLRDSGRALAARIHRPRAAPLLAMCVYLPSRTGAELLGACVSYAMEHGGDFIIMGDFNCTPAERPVASMLAAGGVYISESFEELMEPTRRKGRHIDYAIHSFGTRLYIRAVFDLGDSDHFWVQYETPADDPDPIFRARARAPIDAEKTPIADDDWRCLWIDGGHDARFRAYLEQDDVEAAWCTLSDAAEHLLAGPSAGYLRRSRVARPVRHPPCSPVAASWLPVMARRLWRLRRRAARLRRYYSDALATLVRRSVEDLSYRFPCLLGCEPHLPSFDSLVLQCIDSLLEETKATRLAAWRWIMENDNVAITKWVKQSYTDVSVGPEARRPLDPLQRLEHASRPWNEMWTRELVASCDYKPFFRLGLDLPSMRGFASLWSARLPQATQAYGSQGAWHGWLDCYFAPAPARRLVRPLW